jgi:hypothetical protein
MCHSKCPTTSTCECAVSCLLHLSQMHAPTSPLTFACVTQSYRVAPAEIRVQHTFVIGEHWPQTSLRFEFINVFVGATSDEHEQCAVLLNVGRIVFRFVYNRLALPATIGENPTAPNLWHNRL